jgi:hypothetical protein
MIHGIYGFRLKRLIGVCAVVSSVALSACGSMTGIPGHGGGKRFAIEQELVAATARAAVKDLDVSTLNGRRVAIYVVGMGDQGVGNLMGGRYSVSGMIRGEHVSTPTNDFPVIVANGNENVLNAARKTQGQGHRAEVGIGYNGLGAFRTENVFNPRDAQFLIAIVQESLVLRGVQVVEPAGAEFDVYVTVDVFGTIRSRHDWHLANQESLTAKTALEMTVIDRRSGYIAVPPQTTSYEAEYNEQYVLWAGPISKTKELRKSEPLLVDFTDMSPQQPVYRREGLQVPVQSGAPAITPSNTQAADAPDPSDRSADQSSAETASP